MKKVGIALCIVALWAGAANAAQTVIGINFYESSTSADGLAGKTADGLNNWTDSTGNATGTGLAVLGTDNLVTCDWSSGNTWRAGTNTTPDEQLYHAYLDDGSGGAKVTIRGLGAWLRAVGANSYIVRIYQCTDHVLDATHYFGPTQITDGTSVLQTIQVDQSKEWTTNSSDQRGFVDSDKLSKDSIVILPTVSLSGATVRGCLAGIKITAVSGAPASNPNPADKATEVIADVVMSWTPGVYAGTHNVYLGTSFNDVNNATAGSALLISAGQDANSYDPLGAARLAFGTTYYWRVDEVNASADHTVFKGNVWSFTTEPLYYKVTGITATASSSTATSIPANTINGSGLDANDLHSADATTMWVTAKGTVLPAWIQYDLGRLHKLETMLVWNYNGLFEDSIGIGAKDVTVQYSTNGTDWTPLSGVPQFTQAPGADGYAADTIVDFGGVAARFVKLTITSHWSTNSKTTQTGLSEVRFLEMIDYARTPSPADKATGVSPSVTFSWRSGREAASANVYVGTDPNVLTLSGTTATNSFAPADLSVGTTYSWRVDEVNNAATPSTWAGDVWSFTTPASITVDDMESYNDTTNKLYEVWVDGYNTGTNGAVVGYNDSGTTGTFGDTVTFHGGKQSMPYAYGTGGVTLSEATRTFATSQDWSLHGVKTLVLYFYGSPTNTASQMYVKINNTKVNYTGDAGNISRRRWNQWNVDLTSVAGGVKAVKSLTIGLTGSGKGSLFFDDILLYKDAPAVATPVDPGTTGLVGYYAFNSNVNDSSSAGNNGIVVGTPTYVAGLSATNMAIKLNGTTDCVDLGKKATFNPTGSFSVSLWANIGAWGTAWGHVMVSNRGETDAGGWQIRRGNSTGLCWTTRGIGGTDDLTGATPAQNEWVHVTCVFDQAAATKTLYINGLVSITGTTNANAKITATTTNTYIGARATADNTSRDTFFTGMLDEVRIFNRALTAGEADFLSKP